MSSCAFHLHTCSFHAFEHFPRCPFCNPALLCHPVVISTFLSCVEVKHFRIGPRLAKRPWFTIGRPPVKFVPFGLRLMLQRLTEGPKRPRVCCSPTPLQSGPKPTKTSSIISVVRSRSRGRKAHLIWTLLAPSTYIYVTPSEIRADETLKLLHAPPDISSRAARTCLL